MDVSSLHLFVSLLFYLFRLLVTTPWSPPTPAPCHISLPLTLSSNSTFESLSCVPVNVIIPCLQRRKQRSQTPQVRKTTQLGMLAGDGPVPWTSWALLCALTMVPVTAVLSEGHTRTRRVHGCRECLVLKPPLPSHPRTVWWPEDYSSLTPASAPPIWDPHPPPKHLPRVIFLGNHPNKSFSQNPHLKLSTGKTDAGFKAKSVWLLSFPTVLGFGRYWSYALPLSMTPTAL